MDGRGRLAQSLKSLTLLRERLATTLARRKHASTRRREPSRAEKLLRRWAGPLYPAGLPRGVGVAASIFIIVASLAAGVIQGDHVAGFIAGLRDARDATANAAGFRIASIALTGNRHITREEILATAGVTGRSSLLFLDVDAARARLQTNAWIADATVLKLYPDRLQIGIKERQAFALWQKDGRLSVIAEDGTVVEPFVSRRFLQLPLVVGPGADTQAAEFLTLLDRYPTVREQVRASVLVAERRWNLRLKNGLDVRLPEFDPARALDQLVGLDRDKKLITRDIVAIDLRLNDRVTVRLSDVVAQARADALKEKKSKKKGGDA